MSFPVTECATIILKPGVDIESNTPEADLWKQTLSTVSQQPGYLRAFWGCQLEDPSVLHLLIDWESLDAHNAFNASPAHDPFVKNIMPLLAGLHIHHFRPSTSPSALITASPIIEFATFYDTTDVFKSNLKKFFSTIDEAHVGGGYEGNLYGEVVEEIAKGGAKEGQGKAMRLLVGWQSREDHLKFRETELFRENIGLLREGMSGMEVAHIPLKAV
ncbi:hypothetical protein LSUE1_G000171 [Lachnellula suecica]|uniref:ABM domain-containing protein n=1 Tax=Lachnellula suecica TaxID=602035 RepID=A0A8T9CSB7_9HELO|nr:hypothetical protein LSUE1_G000171 [Lachnellula suecica]